MAPGRLLQNSRRRAETPSGSAPGRHQAVPASDELPPYEPPSQPLNDAARRALAQISNNRGSRKFDDHLKKSTELIRDAVGATNDRAWESYALMQQRIQKLAQKGEDKAEADIEAEQYVEKLGENVSGVTRELEAALRDIIDYRVELEDEPVVLDMVRGELELQAQNWRPREAVKRRKKKESRPSAAGIPDEAMDEDGNAEEEVGEEEEDAEQSEMRGADGNSAITGVNEVLQKVRESKTQDWTGMDMAERYATHNDYILFKRTLHDAQHPNDDATLPHASAWFDPDGRPVLSKVGEDADAAGEEEDDELQIAGEVRTFRCPLSLRMIDEPYSSSKCKHTFDKTAIADYLKDGQEKQCPETGCNQVSRNRAPCHLQCELTWCKQMLRLSDFFLDKILLRKIKRQQLLDAQKEKEDFGDQDEDEVDGDGDTVVTGTATKVKTERRTRGRQIVDDIEDDE